MAPKGGKNGPKKGSTQVAFDGTPKWPPLTPLMPSPALSLDTVLDDQIIVIRNFFTSNLCKNYISFLSGLPLTTTPGKPKRGEATRVNDRYQVDDPTFADKLWGETALQDMVSSVSDASVWGGQVLGLNPNIRVYRYRPGQFFDKHYDESNTLDFGGNKLRAKTTWTLLVYLTACEGGETVFYPEGSGKKGETAPDPVVVGIEAGQALLHRHGESCLLHEGREVTRGEKWVLRSDLVVKR